MSYCVGNSEQPGCTKMYHVFVTVKLEKLREKGEGQAESDLTF